MWRSFAWQKAIACAYDNTQGKEEKEETVV
jgi:hypothetical protein